MPLRQITFRQCFSSPYGTHYEWRGNAVDESRWFLQQLQIILLTRHKTPTPQFHNILATQLRNTRTHTTDLQPFFWTYPGEPVPEETFFRAGATRNLLLDFMVQGEISEADTPTIWLGITTSGLISDPPPTSPIFAPDALPAETLPMYPGLGQAPNMLACIPSGLVLFNLGRYNKSRQLVWVTLLYSSNIVIYSDILWILV